MLLRSTGSGTPVPSSPADNAGTTTAAPAIAEPVAASGMARRSVQQQRDKPLLEKPARVEMGRQMLLRRARRVAEHQVKQVQLSLPGHWTTPRCSLAARSLCGQMRLSLYLEVPRSEQKPIGQIPPVLEKVRIIRTRLNDISQQRAEPRHQCHHMVLELMAATVKVPHRCKRPAATTVVAWPYLCFAAAVVRLQSTAPGLARRLPGARVTAASAAHMPAQPGLLQAPWL